MVEPSLGNRGRNAAMPLHLDGGDEGSKNRNAHEAKVVVVQGVALLVEPGLERVRHGTRVWMPQGRTYCSRPECCEAFQTLGAVECSKAIPVSQRALDPRVGNCRETREARVALPLQLGLKEGRELAVVVTRPRRHKAPLYLKYGAL